ncbi:MAG: alpha/beta hydrolase [Rickettsia endosymbiont of Graphium doson]|nr:alpha/beta hydrolase [Rickettsia endosymbiont of Graphium doson]
MEISSYSVKTKIWGDQKFHSSYKYSWIPSKLPTLIIGSNDDRLLPIELFLKDEEWSRTNIKIVELYNTGHFPWLSCFDQINEELLGLAKDIV